MGISSIMALAVAYDQLACIQAFLKLYFSLNYFTFIVTFSGEFKGGEKIKNFFNA